MDAELQSFNYYSVIIIRSEQGDKSIWQYWMNEQKLGSMNSSQLHELGVKLGPGGVLPPHLCPLLYTRLLWLRIAAWNCEHCDCCSRFRSWSERRGD